MFQAFEASIQLDNITFQPVPEPTTLALLPVAALLAFGCSAARLAAAPWRI